jgi:hypothetical protein
VLLDRLVGVVAARRSESALYADGRHQRAERLLIHVNAAPQCARRDLLIGWTREVEGDQREDNRAQDPDAAEPTGQRSR